MAWWRRKTREDSTSGAAAGPQALARQPPRPVGAAPSVVAVTKDTRPLPVAEILELEAEVVPGRRTELEAIITLGDATSYMRSEVVCLAAVIDVNGADLARWERFRRELGHKQAYMWDDALYDDPPEGVIVAPGLSHTSRLVLAAQGSTAGVYRRTSAELTENYLLGRAEIIKVRDELCSAGMATWGPPALHEALARLTVTDLSPILETLDVKRSWTKAKKLEAMLAAVPHSELVEFVLARDPDALSDTLTIRFPPGIDESFHRAWAKLAAHFVDFAGYRDRDWNEVQGLRAANSWPNLGVKVLPTGDDCSRCRAAARRLHVGDKTTWPPFHLGCRCGVVVEYD